MPNPISKVHPRAEIHLSPDVFVKFPALASYPMRVINEWSYIELFLGTLLASMLRAGLAETLTIYQSTWSGEAKRDALEAVAKHSLTPEDFALFRAVNQVIKPSRECRHHFAHQIWGYSPQLPETLLLAPARLNMMFSYDTSNAGRAGIHLTADTDRDAVQVYKVAELEKAAKEAVECHKLVGRLKLALAGEVGAPEARAKLMHNTRVQQAYNKFLAATN